MIQMMYKVSKQQKGKALLEADLCPDPLHSGCPPWFGLLENFTVVAKEIAEITSIVRSPRKIRNLEQRS